MQNCKGNWEGIKDFRYKLCNKEKSWVKHDQTTELKKRTTLFKIPDKSIANFPIALSPLKTQKRSKRPVREPDYIGKKKHKNTTPLD